MADDDTLRNRREVLTYGSALGVAALAGCVGTTDEEADGSGDSDTYTIGMIDSLSGSLADFGDRNQRAKDLAIDHINEIGVKGQDLEINVEDSEGDVQQGVSAAQKLVNQDSVPFVIGAVGSGVSMSIYESVVQGTDVVQLSQNSTGLGLTDHPGLLRMSPSGRTQSIALADIISEDGYDEVAVTYNNDEFGESLYDAFEEAYEGDIVYESAHDGDQSSYTSLVSEMNNSGAEAWLCITYQQEFATMVTNMYENGYEAQLYGADSNRGDTVLDGTPEGSMDGMKLVEPAAPEGQENYEEFAVAFEDEYDEAPTAWSAFAYDCVVTAALSIQAADEFTGEALGDVVRQTVHRSRNRRGTRAAEPRRRRTHPRGVRDRSPGDPAGDGPLGRPDETGRTGPRDAGRAGDPPARRTRRGVNPTLRNKLAEQVRRLNEQGTTFLLIEHDMEFVMDLADPVVVLDRGSVLTEGPPAVIQSDDQVIDAYLGGGGA